MFIYKIDILNIKLDNVRTTSLLVNYSLPKELSLSLRN